MEYKITIFPEKKEIYINDTLDLLTGLLDNNIPIRSACGGKGICGKCKVIVRKGNFVTVDENLLSEEERRKKYVLACRTRIISDVEIEIPVVYEKFFTPAETIQTAPLRPEEGIFKYFPLTRKIYLKLNTPTLDDSTPDLERILNKLDFLPEIDKKLIEELPSFLRSCNWEVTLTVADFSTHCRVIKMEKGNSVSQNYGMALDIGTTTVVVYLVELTSNKILKAKASYNRQMSFGDDVITRIIYASEKNGLLKLHKAIIETVNDLINNITEEEGILPSDITALMCAGNTTMTHLFFNVSPENIRKEPYVPVFCEHPPVSAKTLGININPEGVIASLPNVASYVGGDIVAGVLASGINNFSTISLLVDLGTNGEIVLGNKEWLLCCACSAGPAFEGVGIKCGIHAIRGAIQRIEIDKKNDTVKYSTIDNEKPKGICGSGLLDIPAELIKNGIINRAGKFIEGSSRFIRRNEDGEMEFVIVQKETIKSDSDIVITESDITNIIRSKGAVFMGILVLLKKVGLNFENINHVFISGGFGTYIDIEKAIIVGLLPDLPHEKFSFIGNSSITGAKMCLLSREARKSAREIAKKMTYIDLSAEPYFMNEYTSTLFIPHTNINLFPSVLRILENVNSKGEGFS